MIHCEFVATTAAGAGPRLRCRHLLLGDSHTGAVVLSLTLLTESDDCSAGVSVTLTVTDLLTVSVAWFSGTTFNSPAEERRDCGLSVTVSVTPSPAGH